MASVSAFSFSKPNHPLYLSSSSPPSTSTALQFQFPFVKPPISCICSIPKTNKCNSGRPTKLRALAEEEETLFPEQESPSQAVTTDQTVSVAVSPSDILTMFFQAEGAMADSAIPTITKALEVVEGITDLKVQIIEGIASVEASSLEDVDATENEHHHHHHHNHSKAPANAPAHAPAKAPAHAPKKALVHPPMKAPMHPPVFQYHTHFCVAKCEEHCKDMRPRKWCMKACTACCAKFKCVPDHGSKHYCNNWDGGVVIRGKIVKCPRRN